MTLYEEYHIDFEEMYYDLAKLLDRPLSKGPNTNEQNQILSSLEDIMKGNIVQRKKFYFKIKGEGEFEMGLLSDGYRKLSMIIYMILSESEQEYDLILGRAGDKYESENDPPDRTGIGCSGSDGVQVLYQHTIILFSRNLIWLHLIRN